MVAFLAPTCSYIAYANHSEHVTAQGAERQMGRLLTFGHADLYMYQHPELGGSLYDTHADGSGVCYSGRLRPVLNFAPRYHSWLGGHGSAVYQYNAETHLFDWLEHQHFDYDVVTDEDLPQDGLGVIADYRVIITGTHPEYHSTRMWDAMKAWLDRGGRLMYMGGNGWYWRIAFHDELPGWPHCGAPNMAFASGSPSQANISTLSTANAEVCGGALDVRQISCAGSVSSLRACDVRARPALASKIAS